MSFVPDDDQRALVESVRRFFAERSPISAVRALAEGSDGFDAQVWRLATDQLGLVGLAVPEKFGGQGFGFVDQALVFEEAGRALWCAPYFATAALALPTLLAADDEEVIADLVPAIAAGEVRATLALSEGDGTPGVDAVRLRAEPAGQGWTLTGEKSFVVDGHTADLLLVVARTAAGPSVFAVRGDAAGLDRRAMTTLDHTRKQARLMFEQVPGRLVGTQGAAAAIVGPALDRAVTALAMEQVGGAARCLEMVVEYSATRMQFGRRIGSFQAIKHKCADMLIALEEARSVAYHAAWSATHALDELPVAAAMAAASAAEAFTFVAAETVQVHGGIGFTWEHDAHLYFRRAHTSAVLLGDAAYHRERLACLLGL